MALKYAHKGDDTTVVLGNELDTSIASDLEAGIFASSWKGLHGPKVDVGVGINSKLSLKLIRC